jgi:hypothetical protein
MAVKVFVKLVKVKQSLFGSGQSLRNPGTEVPKFQDGKHINVVRSALRTGRFYPHPLPRKYSWYSFMLEVESTPWTILRPEGLCQ